MGYRIDYDGSTRITNYRTSTGIRLRTLVAAGILLFSITVRTVWPDGSAVLQSVFIPTDLNATEIAFSELMEDICHGEPLGSSITTFCQKIIDDAA